MCLIGLSHASLTTWQKSTLLSQLCHTSLIPSLLGSQAISSSLIPTLPWWRSSQVYLTTVDHNAAVFDAGCLESESEPSDSSGVMIYILFFPLHVFLWMLLMLLIHVPWNTLECVLLNWHELHIQSCDMCVCNMWVCVSKRRVGLTWDRFFSAPWIMDCTSRTNCWLFLLIRLIIFSFLVPFFISPPILCLYLKSILIMNHIPTFPLALIYLLNHLSALFFYPPNRPSITYPFHPSFLSFTSTFHLPFATLLHCLSVYLKHSNFKAGQAFLAFQRYKLGADSVLFSQDYTDPSQDAAGAPYSPYSNGGSYQEPNTNAAFDSSVGYQRQDY